MFGFNKELKNEDYMQSILSIIHDSAHDSDVYKEHLKYISEESIFYDEGIMNI
jgi:hypothetical protein